VAEQANDTEAGTPQSPETQEEYVREELDQDMISHQGEYRRQANSTPTAAADRSKHLGATDDEVVPITPPMAGPADLLGERNEDAQGNDGDLGDEMIDPREELTPG
jgi:hypothetical protein